MRIFNIFNTSYTCAASKIEDPYLIYIHIYIYLNMKYLVFIRRVERNGRIRLSKAKTGVNADWLSLILKAMFTF